MVTLTPDISGTSKDLDYSCHSTPLLSTSVALGRRDLTARRSLDCGLSWNTYEVLEREFAAYSALVDLHNGWAGCLYETKRARIKAPAHKAKARLGPPEMDDIIRFVTINASSLTSGTRADTTTKIKEEL
jgi:hypothetical protein